MSRKRRRTTTQTLFNFAGLLLAVSKMLARYAGATYRDQLEAAKLEKVQEDAQLVHMRKQKVANELVISDLKILQMKRDLAIPDPEHDFKPVDYDPS